MSPEKLSLDKVLGHSDYFHHLVTKMFFSLYQKCFNKSCLQWRRVLHLATNKRRAKLLLNTVTVLAVDMCRKRGLSLGTFISGPLCSADLLPDCQASIFYAAVETQQGHLLCVTSSLLLKSSSCWNWGSEPQLQQRAMTFKWARSKVAAPWPGLIGWCHRKWIVSLSRVTTTDQQHVCLSSDVITGWRQSFGTDTITLICAPRARTTCAWIHTERLCRSSRPEWVLTNIIKCLR